MLPSEIQLHYQYPQDIESSEQLAHILRKIPVGSLLWLSDVPITTPTPISKTKLITRPTLRERETFGTNPPQFHTLQFEAGTMHINERVAIKPFQNEEMLTADMELGPEGILATEYCIASELEQSSAPTFDYLGFAKTHKSILTLTRYDERVRSLDTIIRAPGRRPDRVATEFALSIGATTLVALHSREIIHDDFGLQNTAYDTRTFGARTIDLDFVRKASDSSDFAHNAWQYISTLHQSETPHATPSSQTVDEVFTTPYIDQMTPHLTEANGKKLRTAIDKLRQRTPFILEERPLSSTRAQMR